MRADARRPSPRPVSEPQSLHPRPDAADGDVRHSPLAHRRPPPRPSAVRDAAHHEPAARRRFARAGARVTLPSVVEEERLARAGCADDGAMARPCKWAGGGISRRAEDRGAALDVRSYVHNMHVEYTRIGGGNAVSCSVCKLRVKTRDTGCIEESEISVRTAEYRSSRPLLGVQDPCSTSRQTAGEGRCARDANLRVKYTNMRAGVRYCAEYSERCVRTSDRDTVSAAEEQNGRIRLNACPLEC